MRQRFYPYQVTYRIHDGYQYNEPSGYSEKTETVWAKNRNQAYEIASKRADTPSLIAHDPVTVFKKDVVRQPGKGKFLFNVTLYFHTSATVQVLADDENDAEVEAYAKCGDKSYDSAFLHNMTHDGDPDIEEAEEDDYPDPEDC